MIKLIFMFCFFMSVLSSQSMEYYFIESEYDKTKLGRWTKVDSAKIAYQLYFKGACCDMPVVENMRAIIENGTLYIYDGIPVHDTHDEIGICGISIDFVMNKAYYPGYNNLKVTFTQKK